MGENLKLFIHDSSPTIENKPTEHIEAIFFSNVFLNLHLSFSVCQAVKINKVTIPSLYEIKGNSETLRLDCDFTVEENETGFVLKWLHNAAAIYQWIPSKKTPFALVSSQLHLHSNKVSHLLRFREHLKGE